MKERVEEEETPVELDQFYSTTHIAEMFQVTTETVRRWILDGHLTGIQINGHWRVPRRSLMAFAQSRYGA